MKRLKAVVITSIIIISIFCITFFSYNKFSLGGIEIDSDSDFKRYRCLGKGTITDPYILENRKLSASDNSGIYVSHTTKYFVIQNCIIEGRGSGIEIRYVAEGTAKIVNCTIMNTGWYRGALRITHVDGIEIINNTLISNNMIGQIERCSNVIFSDNYMLNNYGGLVIGSYTDYGDFENIVIENNIFENSPWVGLYIGEVSSLRIRRNNFYNSSIGFDTDVIQRSYYYDTFVIEDNFVDDKPIGVFNSQDNLNLTIEYGQLLLFNCMNLTLINQNFRNVYRAFYAYHCINLTIIDSTFDASFAEAERNGVYMAICESLVLDNVTFIEGEYSFYYGGSKYVDIQNSSFINQTRYCIYFDNPEHGQIINNYFMFESSVTMLSGSVDWLTLENNTIVTY